jgi:SsrA-binding protein
LVKVEIALAKGRHTYDKRRKLKEKTEKREAQREMRNW